MHLNKILIRLSNRYGTHQLCPIAIIPRSNLHRYTITMSYNTIKHSRSANTWKLIILQ